MVELLFLIGIAAIYRDVHFDEAAFAIDRDRSGVGGHVNGGLIEQAGPLNAGQSGRALK